jgi:hypothetical protein
MDNLASLAEFFSEKKGINPSKLYGFFYLKIKFPHATKRPFFGFALVPFPVGFARNPLILRL